MYINPYTRNTSRLPVGKTVAVCVEVWWFWFPPRSLHLYEPTHRQTTRVDTYKPLSWGFSSWNPGKRVTKVPFKTDNQITPINKKPSGLGSKPGRSCPYMWYIVWGFDCNPSSWEEPRHARENPTMDASFLPPLSSPCIGCIGCIGTDACCICSIGDSTWVKPQNDTSSYPLWNLEMDGWKTSFLLGWPIFRCYFSFR